jgi:hypothetical protein
MQRIPISVCEFLLEFDSGNSWIAPRLGISSFECHNLRDSCRNSPLMTIETLARLPNDERFDMAILDELIKL